jgi:DNA/RNA-binding domain of Phe-tRNA-synthetase-like protein
METARLFQYMWCLDQKSPSFPFVLNRPPTSFFGSGQPIGIIGFFTVGIHTLSRIPMEFSQEVLTSFPGICVAESDIRSVHITKESTRLEALKREIILEIRSRYSLEKVKDEPLFRAYRDFFWSVGVDPTKTRPASEALVRRILSGGKLPTINTAVDAYNLASARSGIPIAAFDANTLTGDLTMRFAKEGELFLGIGMVKPVVLQEKQVIVTDPDNIIAIYPYRDSDATKVTMDTMDIRILMCGVPRVERERVVEASEVCAGYLKEYAGGVPSSPEVFPGK